VIEMNKKIILRVNKIESYRDPNGSLGKKIELVEDLENISTPLNTEYTKLLNEAITQMQVMIPTMKATTNLSTPKILLCLTEEEYDALALNLDVNHTYEVTFEGQAIKFKGTDTNPAELQQ